MSTYKDEIVNITNEGDLLKIEVCNIITTEMKRLLLCSGGSSAPVMYIQGCGEQDGFYCPVKIPDANQVQNQSIFCRPSREKSRYIEEHYKVEVVYGRLRLAKKGGSADGQESAESGRASLLMLPPLTFWCRTSIFNIDKIDTIAQSFQADFYYELRLNNVIEGDDREGVTTLLQHYEVGLDMIDFLNISEVIGDKESWDQLCPGRAEGFFTYVVKRRMRAVVNEQMEVHTFPFDIQPMCLALTFNCSVARVALEPNQFYPSIFFMKQFQSASVYDVVYGDIVLAEPCFSDPSESSAGYVYPRCVFSTYFARRPAFYLSNVVMPMTLLTLLGPLSNAVEADGSLMGTGDRLSVSLTLLLTAVAYKFIVATSLPQVSYLTALDVQVLLCFAFLVVSAIENVLYPYLAARFDIDSTFEVYFVICYYSAFFLAHFLLFAKLGLWLFFRRGFFQTDLLTRRVMKETYARLLASGHTADSDKELVDFVVDQTLANKDLKRPVAVNDPKHQYAVGGLKISGASSKKVGQEEGEPAGLVSAAETHTAVEEFLARKQEVDICM